MAKIIELTNHEFTGVVPSGPDEGKVFNYKKPAFKASDGEVIELSDLELVCVEPVVEYTPGKNEGSEAMASALKKAEKYQLPYVMLSDKLQILIGVSAHFKHVYLAQFYRTK